MKRMTSVVVSVALVLSTFTLPSVTVLAGETLNVSSEAELKSALNKENPVDAINITASFSIDEDCMIYLDPGHINNYNDTVLTISEGVTLTIDRGGKLGSFWPSYEGEGVANSKVINNGTVIINDGGATEADLNTNNGDILVKNGGKAVCCKINNGTVTVEAGGSYVTTQGSEAVNYGTINIQKGARMESRFGTTIVNNPEGTIQLNGQFDCACIGMGNENVAWFENKGTVVGNGDLILLEASHEELPVFDMDDLIVQIMTQLGQTSRFENWEDVNIYKKVTASNFEELKNTATSQRVVAGENVPGNMDTIVELVGNVEIPAGESIGTMAKIIVPEGVKVIVNKGAELEAGIENHGTIEVKSGGLLATTQGGNIDNYSEITVEKGASIKSQMGGSIINNKDADMKLDGNLYCGFINYDNMDHYWFENSGSINGSGNFYIYEPGTGEVIPMSKLPESVKDVLAQIGGNAHITDHGIQLGKSSTSEKKTTPTVQKKTNTLFVKVKKASLKFKKLKKKKQVLKCKKVFVVKNAIGIVTYKLASAKKGKKNVKKFFKMAKNGNITVKKGLKKGKYKLKVEITASGNGTYKSVTKSVTVKVTVK